MKYILKSLIFLSLSLVILSCGSGVSKDFSSDITVASTKSNLNVSEKKMNIEFLLSNNYSSKVMVEIDNLELGVAPCEVLSSKFIPNEFNFNEKSSVKVKAELIFVEECTPNSYQLEGTTLLTFDGDTREVVLDSKTQELNVSITPSVAGVTITNNDVSTNTDTNTNNDVSTNTDVNTNTDVSTNTDTNTTTLIVPIEDIILPTIVIPSTLKEIKLTTNSKSIEIPIKVFKDVAPYTVGSVKVELPLKALAGTDVGLFETYEVPINAQGIALFKYTGPSNLKALISNDDNSSIFKFYHVENANSKKELKIVYAVAEDSFVPIDYSLSVTTQDSDFSMGIGDLQKTFTVNLKGSDGNIINNNDVEITKVEVTTENALIVQLLDNETGERKNTVLLTNENSSAFILNSKKLSGIAPIRVTMNFIDINKKEKELSLIINIRVMSGPPSAISVSYVSTGHDLTRAKYEEKFAISVTDEYGNRVNTKPYISLGAIIGYAVDGREASALESNNTKRLYYAKFDIDRNNASGTINTLGDGTANTTQFEDSTASRSDVFQWVNSEGINSDKLVVFGKGKNYEAMGKWDFTKLDNNTLSLNDDYFGENRGELYYAIGHNYYQDQCRDDGREWLGSTDSDTYQLDEEGTVIVSYKYDYHLTGKDALIWVNLNGYQSDTAKNTRIGEVSKHTLRGKGLISKPSGGYSILKGSTNSHVHFNIHHSSIAEWYHNARFAHAVLPNVCASVRMIDSSNLYDARTCNNEGVAYVTYEVTAAADKDCSFNIETTGVYNEF